MLTRYVLNDSWAFIQVQKDVNGIGEERESEYRSTLQRVASPEGIVILALVDKTYIDMATNFYETSIKPLHISNMLFISLSKSTCLPLVEKGLECFAYSEHDPAEEVDAAFGSDIFKHKMNVRASFIIDALKWNYKILLTDLDIVYFKNPLPYFTCTDCDMECLEDGSMDNLNAGFLFMRPTKMAMSTYQLRVQLTDQYKQKTDQMLFNMALKQLTGKVKVRALPRDSFPCGKFYFEYQGRHFTNNIPCETCVVVHNNWIVGKDAKVYRFKENNLWLYDENQYYSNEKAKFLMYDNPVIFHYSFLWKLMFWRKNNANLEHEIRALRNALAIGQILKRIVVLPKFHDYLGNEVSLLSLVYLSNFDKTFHGLYREHSFPSNPKVPNNIKEAVSKAEKLVFFIPSAKHHYADIEPHSAQQVIHVTYPKLGASSDEIINHFSPYYDVPVIKFHNLYGAFSHFDNGKEDIVFNEAANKGLTEAKHYRQYGNKRPIKQ